MGSFHLVGMKQVLSVCLETHIHQWYTKQEQGIRTAYWGSFVGLTQIFGGLVMYGIVDGNEKHGFNIKPWKIIFLLNGLQTIVASFIFLAIVPDNQLMPSG